jgi:hydrogenase maturation protein HypF
MKKHIIQGIVQGVGFRPKVKQLAEKIGAKGYVLNNGSGVEIVVDKENFLDILLQNLPPLAKIENIKTIDIKDKPYDNFYIKTSKSSSKSTSISPDIAICDECLRDMFDKNNKRYLYPFINCTNCGPRYTIIKEIPYDRKNTSMSSFAMCESCQQEYNDSNSRFFHAQPISCPNSDLSLSKPIHKISDFIKDGKIIALKGLGGFHLVCDATNQTAIKTLRKRKNRPFKPLAIMFRNIDILEKYCKITPKEKELIISKEKPIVVVQKKIDLPCIADGLDRYGVFLPYTPIHHLLFQNIDTPLVMTSANISGEPIIRDIEELQTKLSNVYDEVLDYNRKIINSCDDSVVMAINNTKITLRNARGYAPSSFYIDKKLSPNILALGANQKSTISLAFGNKVILSPHIGDLQTIDSVEYFERTIETFRKFYNFKEDIIVCDKHPRYESTLWAKNQNKETIQIQHHYAHLLSTMFEFNLTKNYLCFCFDGTGYGDDGNIWGGEVFIANQKEYKRIYNFKYFKLIGSEKAIKNPKNTAINLKTNKFDKILAPLTSSVGRIFDVVGYLGGFIEQNSFEGESGMKIENFYDPNIKDSYEFIINNGIIDFTPMIQNIEKDKTLVASKFINSLVNTIKIISKEFDLPIILSGGVFQNKTLLTQIIKNIDKKIYFNQKTPINDGGISLGQIYSIISNL